MEPFDLAVLFTASGAIVGGAFVKVLLSLGKAWGVVPENGRGILYANAVLSAVLIGLAAWSATWVGGVDLPQDILVIVLSWLGVYSSAIGVHETAAKVQNVMSGTTNPAGPDQ